VSPLGVMHRCSSRQYGSVGGGYTQGGVGEADIPRVYTGHGTREAYHGKYSRPRYVILKKEEEVL